MHAFPPRLYPPPLTRNRPSHPPTPAVGSIRLNSAVKSVSPGRVTLRNGDILTAAAIVVATDEPSTRSILGSRMGPSDLKTPVKGRGSTCLYYATPGKPPIGDPLLILNGEGTSDKAPVNNVVFLNSINRDYAPPGQSLVSVTVVSHHVLSSPFHLSSYPYPRRSLIRFLYRPTN